jgi:acetyltransferase-like isoleucine patch superfamily enzyme
VLKKVVLLLLTFCPSPVRVAVYRLLGFRVGKNVRISFGALLLADELMLDDRARVRALSLVSVRRLHLGRGSIIASLAVIHGRADLIMGDRSRISTSCLVDCTADVILGDCCAIGPRNNLYTHASYLPVTLGYPNHRKAILLGNHVWTGIANTILPGTTSGNHVFTLPHVVMSGHVADDTCLTPRGPRPIRLIRRKRPIAELYRTLVAGMQEERSVHCPDLAMGEPDEDAAALTVLIEPGLDRVRSALASRRTVVAFFESMDPGLRGPLDALAVDWYDFQRTEMASLDHRDKPGMLEIFDALGGMKFLEPRS